MGRILVPTDLSDSSLEALKHAAEIARLFTTEIILLHAVSDLEIDGSSKSGAQIEEDLLEARKSLVHLLLQHNIVQRNVKTEVTVGSPVAAIVRGAEMFEVDLIIICTHARTGWHHALAGSIAEHVARLSPVPVLVVKSEAGDVEDPQVDLRFVLHRN